MQEENHRRIEIIDGLRGAAIIYVIIYHLFYDLSAFGFIALPEEETGLTLAVHIFFYSLLIIISGVCTAFSRNIFRRGTVLLLLGSGLTVFTEIFLPNEAIIFGILSFLGSMMLQYGLAKPLLDKLHPAAIFAVWVLLFVIFRDFETEQGVIHLFVTDIHVPLPSDRLQLYPLGIMYNGFSSADYFPIIPYGFIFLAGTALSKPIAEGKLPPRFYSAKVPILRDIGRYSLLIYLAHQPIFFLILTIIRKAIYG